jgi:hypothetical protein
LNFRIIVSSFVGFSGEVAAEAETKKKAVKRVEYQC